jgi:hypothetical protein
LRNDIEAGQDANPRRACGKQYQTEQPKYMHLSGGKCHGGKYQSSPGNQAINGVRHSKPGKQRRARECAQSEASEQKAVSLRAMGLADDGKQSQQ